MEAGPLGLTLVQTLFSAKKDETLDFVIKGAARNLANRVSRIRHTSVIHGKTG